MVMVPKYPADEVTRLQKKDAVYRLLKKQCQEKEKKVELLKEELHNARKEIEKLALYRYILNEKGKLPGISGYTVDVSEYIRWSRQAEWELKNQINFMQTLIDTIPSPIFYKDINFVYQGCNKAFCSLLGLNKEDVIGKTVHDLFPRELADIYHEKDVLLLFKPGVQTYESRVKHAGGTFRDVVYYKAAYLDTCGETAGIVGVAVDITERKGMEENLRLSEERFKNELARLDRLSIVGEMAAGIGHEIRNPMTTVRGFLQMLGSKVEIANYKEYFDIMISELDRANLIITEFLGMAKNKQADLKSQNLNEIINKITPLISADANYSEMFLKIETGDIPDMLLDEKEIRQLIFNLVRNGFEAMSPGGELTITTCWDNGDVVLSVKDQGRGIPHETLDKIGTTFYTTKESGTGLGLATCRSIAARHRAKIEVNSCPGETIFHVRFRDVQEAKAQG